jgi:IclR family transcriptional regulator, acetate operon repressor
VVSRRSIRSPRLIGQQLVQVRRSGLAYDYEEVQPGVFCVAAPVFRAGKAIASVSLTRVGGTATTPGDAAAVRRTSIEITRWLEADS